MRPLPLASEVVRTCMHRRPSSVGKQASGQSIAASSQVLHRLCWIPIALLLTFSNANLAPDASTLRRASSTSSTSDVLGEVPALGSGVASDAI